MLRSVREEVSYRDRSRWPSWGIDYGHDLQFGSSGALGQGAQCDQGRTYAGVPNDACGGYSGARPNWGATEMEVWYRVGS